MLCYVVPRCHVHTATQHDTTQQDARRVQGYHAYLSNTVIIAGEDVFVCMAALGHQFTPFVDGGTLVAHNNPGFFCGA